MQPLSSGPLSCRSAQPHKPQQTVLQTPIMAGKLAHSEPKACGRAAELAGQRAMPRAPGPKLLLDGIALITDGNGQGIPGNVPGCTHKGSFHSVCHARVHVIGRSLALPPRSCLSAVTHWVEYCPQSAISSKAEWCLVPLRLEHQPQCLSGTRSRLVW